MKIFSSVVVFVFVIMFLPLTTSADMKIFETEQTSLSFYGYLKLNAIFQDHDTNGEIAARWPKPDLAEFDNNNFVFTPTETRFGFKIGGPEVYENTKIRGLMEFDLYDSSSRNSMKVRIRHAYIKLENPSYSILIGQYWDLFGGGVLESWLINGFYVETGNMGFRRTQLCFRKYVGKGEFAVSLSDPTSSAGSKSGLPVLSARCSYKISDNSYVGFSGVYGQEKYDSNTVGIEGLSVDFRLRFLKRLSLLGEFNGGKNLRIFGSRSSVFLDPLTNDYEGMDVLSGWAELVYYGSKVNVYAGYTREELTDDGQIAPLSLQDSYALFAGFEHKLGKGFSYGAEFTEFNGHYSGLNNSDAFQTQFSVRYKF